MATGSIDPLHFFIQVQPSLLAQYAAYYGLTFESEQTTAGEEAAEEFMKFLHSLPEEKQKDIWSDFYEIDSIASKEGCDRLVNGALKQGKNLEREAFTNLRNDKERAIYFHLNHNDILASVTVEYNIDNLQGWRAERTVCKTIKDVTPHMPAFVAALKAFYNEEYRGHQIKVKKLEKIDRTIFTAYIEDTYTSDPLFEESGLLNSKAIRRPVFSIYFLYRPQDGILEVKAPGGSNRIQDLQKIFIKTMLQTDPTLQEAMQFDFEKIKELTDPLPLYSEDGIDRVTLCGLRLVDNHTKSTHSIDIGPHRTTGVRPMMDILSEKNIDLKDYQITQFKFEVVFKKDGKGRARKVTVKVSSPNICDLKERPIDYIVRELLKRWELALF